MLGMTMARLQNILWLEIFWISYRSSKKCSWCDTVRLTRPGHSLACSIVPIISQHIHPSPSCHHISSVCVHMFRVSSTPVHRDNRHLNYPVSGPKHLFFVIAVCWVTTTVCVSRETSMSFCLLNNPIWISHIIAEKKSNWWSYLCVIWKTLVWRSIKREKRRQYTFLFVPIVESRVTIIHRVPAGASGGEGDVLGHDIMVSLHQLHDWSQSLASIASYRSNISKEGLL